MRYAVMALNVLIVVGILCPVAEGQGRPQKKIIEYGWDVPYPDFLSKNIRRMEQLPFDGVIFRLRPEHFNWVFNIRRWDEQKLKGEFDDLKAIEWKKFTDNFLIINVGNYDGSMDWFDDGHWQIISANLRLASKAAKLGRCVGICFDAETWTKHKPWIYPGKYKDRSFAEVSAQSRRRGAQFMEALQGEMPKLKLLTFWMLSDHARLHDEPDAQVREQRLIKTTRRALLPGFFNGMLDAIGPDVRIIDGWSQSYWLTGRDDFFRGYHMIKNRALAMVVPENRAKYTAHVQAGMALYLDGIFATRPPRNGYLCYFLTPEEQVRWLEHNVYYALTAPDEQRAHELVRQPTFPAPYTGRPRYPLGSGKIRSGRAVGI